MRGRDCALGTNGVVQRLTEDCKIDTVLGHRRVLNVAQAVLKIFETMFARQFRSELDHFFRIIDGYNLTRGFGEQLRKGPLARAKIDNRLRWQQWNKRMRQRLPGTARHVTASKFSREFIEIFARFVLTFTQGQLQRGAISRRFRQLAREHSDDFVYTRHGAVALRPLDRSVINIFAGTPVFNDAGTLQLSEMTGDTRLPESHDLLQLRDGEFFFLEQKEQAQARRVGQKSQ